MTPGTTTRECVQLRVVTSGHVDKDGGHHHLIRETAITENPMLQANSMALYVL